MIPQRRQGKWFEVGRHRCRIDINEGYDCRNQCAHEKKGDHGCHGDEWRFIVGTEAAALSLLCFTNMLRSEKTFSIHHREGNIWGAYLALHDGRKSERAKENCDILPQGCLPTDGQFSCTLAETVFTPFTRVTEPYLYHPILEIRDETLKELGTKLDKMWAQMTDIMWHWLKN